MAVRASDIPEAIGLLTRMPVRLAGAPRGAAAAWAYPLAGLVVGGIGALVAWLCSGLPSPVTAGLVLASMVIVTGALHEDGLADTADGLWGGWTRERRLDIMKDSRIGAYGVLALILGLGLRWSALSEIETMALTVLAAAVLSRAPMIVLMHALPQARTQGLAASTGRPDRATALMGCGIALGIALILLGASALWLAALLAALALGIALIARAKIGGQTGDILGATQQLSEIAILIALAAG